MRYLFNYSDDDNRTTIRLGALEVVQIVLIVLKLFKLINWPWVKVLIPLWIDIGIILILLLAIGIIYAWRYWHDR